MNIFTKSKYGFLLLFLLSISVYGVAQPLNDNCLGAQAVTTGTYFFNTSTATASPEATCNANPADFAKDIWYEYTPNCSADITFSLCGSSFNTYMDIYTGSCGALSCLASNDDACAVQSQLTVLSPTPGVTYFIRIGGVAGASGAGQMVVSSSDNTPPVISGCPVDQTLTNDAGVCGAVATWTPPTGFDNCDFQGLTTTHPPGSTFSVGTTTVVYTASDAAGNTATCSFDITVTDTEAPVVSGCPTNITQSNDLGNCGAFVTWTDPTATDNCGITATFQSHASGSFFNVGTTTVLYTWEDAAGNVSTCTFDVIVNDTELPSASCQNATLNLGPAGFVIVGLADVDNGSTDNCAFVVDLDTDTLTCADIGIPIIVTLTVTDASGNTATCQSTVTVQDVENPTAVCQDITVYLDGSGNAAIVDTDIDGGSTDNCGIVSYTASQTAFTCADLGANNVTLTVEDGSGNIDACVAIVTVADTISPVISNCPVGPIVVSSGAGCNAPVSWTEPTANDNCDGAMTYTTRSHAPGDVFPTGTTTVTYTFEDGSGNASVCTFDVVVEDNVPPTAQCVAGPVTVFLGAGGTAVIDPLAIDDGSTDNCGSVNLSVSPSIVTCADIGVPVLVTLTVTDSSGNTATCQTTVDVQDIDDPTAVCQNITIQLDPSGNATIVASDIDGGSFDNCTAPGSLILTASQTAFTCADIGPNNVTLTVEDADGNIDNCIAVVTVEDITDPIAVCQNITVQLDASGNATITGTDIDGGSSDACGIALMTATPNTFTCTEVGANNVILTVEDNNGNTSTCVAVVTVEDNVPPTAVCQNITVQLDATGNATIIASDIDGGSSDACGILGISASQTAFTCADIGPNNVILTVEDVNGNTSTCTAVVTVEDNIDPTAVCQDITVALDINGNATITGMDIDGGSSDNCTVVSWTATPNTFDCSNVGVNSVILTVEDQSGNTATCLANVTVIDNILPTFSFCPTDTTVSTVQGDCSQLVSWNTPVVVDNCPVTITSTHSNPSLFPVGSTTVTYTATDASGNTATCSFVVTVEDNELPQITNCPSNVILPTLPGQCATLGVWAQPTASDNCPGVTLTSTHNPGSIFFPGTTVVTYTATDASGNTATCQFTVTVIDVEAPTISGCPSNITVSNDPGVCGANVSWTAPTATDNCPGMTFTSTHNPGDLFSIGTTTVVYTATDASGNTATCTFTVTVNDVEAPVMTNCPTDITVDTDPGVCDAVVTWTGPNFTDNCSFTLTASHNSGDVFPLGTTTVTITATDPSGNSTTCTFDVTVEDNELPVIAGCPLDITVGNDLDDCGAMVTWTAPTATDNCGISSFTSSHNPGDFFPIGTTAVTYTATDVNGNVSICEFDVTVNDTQLPTITCPADITVSNDAGSCDAFVTVPQPVVSDNCPPALQSVTIQSENFNACATGAPAGWSTVILSGSADWEFNSGVIPGGGTGNDFPTCAAIFDDDGAGSSGDNTVELYSPVVDITQYFSTNLSFDYIMNAISGLDNLTVEVWDGSTWVQVLFIDNDIISSFSQSMTAYANPNFQVRFTYDDNDGWGWGAGIDNFLLTGQLGQYVIINDYNNTDDASDTYPVGTTTVTWTVTDANGNTATCTMDVTVNDTELPVIANCPNDIVTCGTTTATWTPPTATDNCPGVTMTSTHNPGDVFPPGTTTVVYTATDASGNTAICSFTVTLGTAVVADAGADAALCFGNFVTIGGSPTASGGTAPYTYSWIPASGLSSATAANPSASPTATTTYTLTVTDVNGCTATDEVTVTVYPVPTVDAGVDQNICLGGSVQIGGNPTASLGTAPYTYTWFPATDLDNPAIANPVASPTTTTTYTVAVQDVNGCTRFDEITVTVSPTPVADAGPDVLTCAGTAVQIGGTPTGSGTAAPYGYFWTPATGLDDASLANPMASPMVSTTYTVTVIDNNGCSSTDEVTVNVNPAPVVDAGADDTLCVGNSVMLGGAPTASGTLPPYSFSWSPAAGLSSVTDPNPMADPTTTTTYTVTVTDANGCTSTGEVTIVVIASPTVVADPTGPFCEFDQPVTLTGTPAGGTWTGTGIVAGNMFDPATAGPGTFDLVYSFTNMNGCTNSDTIAVVVDPAPDATITTAGPFCESDAPVTFTAVTPGGTWTGNGITPAGVFDPAVAGVGAHLITYSVMGVNCLGMDTLTVNVLPAPDATINPVSAICENDSPITLTAATAGGTWGGSPAVNPVTGVFDPSLATTPSETVTYTLTSGGCTSVGTLTITINTAPAPNITSTGPYCVSQGPVTLTADIPGGFWSGSGIINPFSGLFDPAIAGTGAITITYTVSNAAGCTGTATAIINVTTGPNATINPVGPLCANSAPVTLTAATAGGTWSGPGVVGNTFNPALTGSGTFVISYTLTSGGCTSVGNTTITVNQSLDIDGFITDVACSGTNSGAISLAVSGGSGGYTYLWSNNATTQNVSNLAPGTYTVTVTSAGACTQVASFTVVAPMAPLAATAIITPTLTPQMSNGAIDISVSGGTPGYTFDWSTGATTEDVSGLAAGTYTVQITDANGCTVIYTYDVKAEFGIGIDDVKLAEHINLYPNPTSNILNIDIEIGMTKDLDMIVVDMLGRRIAVIHDVIDGKYSYQLDMTRHAAGQYMIIFNIDGEIVNKKFNLTR